MTMTTNLFLHVLLSQFVVTSRELLESGLLLRSLGVLLCSAHQRLGAVCLQRLGVRLLLLQLDLLASLALILQKHARS